MATSDRLIDVSKYRDVEIKNFRMRPITGEDLITAASRCAPLEGESLDPMLFQMMMRQHQIAQSITEVDGSPMRGPCLASLKWSSRTREFVAEAYNYINGVVDDERASFLAALAGGAGADPTPPASSAAG